MIIRLMTGLPLWMIHKWGYWCPTIASVMRLMMTMMFDLWGWWSRSCWQWWPRWRWCEWDGGANAVGPLSHRAWQADLAAPWGALTHLPCGSIKSYSFIKPRKSPRMESPPSSPVVVCINQKLELVLWGPKKCIVMYVYATMNVNLSLFQKMWTIKCCREMNNQGIQL